MIKGQKLVNEGIEIALFPMEYLTITQGRYSRPTHIDYNAIDLAGKDRGIDPLYAPFSLQVEWVDNGPNKTGIVVSNAKSVLMANGKVQAPRTIMMMLWHANSITHLRAGMQIPQGQEFYKEGTSGYATGNHVHLELAYGQYAWGTYPLFQMPSGYWTLKGTELHIEDCFFVNDTVMQETKGYKFKTYIKPKPTPMPELKYKIGDKVNVDGVLYYNSAGARPGLRFKGTSTIQYTALGQQFPYHIQGKGWVSADAVSGTVTPPANLKEYVVLLQKAGTWGVYKLGVYPVVKNIWRYLSPGSLGDLTYEILGRPYANTVTIKTRDYGTVNVWIGPNTPHRIVKK